mmetsp:Transcript_1566/g.5929  ORF Transcript_1566/g.5929 Transcript_1566/m.5929 type:complete len:153 (+) Transcript_1566:1558-2016(+)
MDRSMDRSMDEDDDEWWENSRRLALALFLKDCCARGGVAICTESVASAERDARGPACTRCFPLKREMGCLVTVNERRPPHRGAPRGATRANAAVISMDANILCPRQKMRNGNNRRAGHAEAWRTGTSSRKPETVRNANTAGKSLVSCRAMSV